MLSLPKKFSVVALRKEKKGGRVTLVRKVCTSLWRSATEWSMHTFIEAKSSAHTQPDLIIQFKANMQKQ